MSLSTPICTRQHRRNLVRCGEPCSVIFDLRLFADTVSWWRFFVVVVSGALVLLWRRGPNVLTASQLMVTQDERIRLMDGYNLEITELEPQDAGDYVCQISDKVNKDQVHTVEILGKCCVCW